MSRREQALERECQILRREVAALEELVGRYQDELHAITARRSRSGSSSPRLSYDVARCVEELYEHQRLYPSGWETRLQPDDRPALCHRRTGVACGFDEVALPSADWEWVTTWRCDVNASTDENGWTYAPSWGQLDDVESPPHSEKILDDRVRRRTWTRERMLIRASGLPATLNRQLAEECRVTAVEKENEKLTQQLARANERIVEYEVHAREYETQIVRLQELTERVSLRSSPILLPASPPPKPGYRSRRKSSGDVLSHTEALLDQILSGSGLADLDVTATIDAQERHSFMVESCQQELQDAVAEFNDLVGKTSPSVPQQQQRQQARPRSNTTPIRKTSKKKGK